MTRVGNPIRSGFVKNFSLPCVYITFLTNISIEFSSKYLEFLFAVAPNVTRVSVLIYLKHSNHPTVL